MTRGPRAGAQDAGAGAAESASGCGSCSPITTPGIDDSLLGGVIDSKFDGYRLVDQWTSYGWNVFSMRDGNDYGQIIGALKTMEEWDPADRRPMIVFGKTIKGYWPGAVARQNPGSAIRWWVIPAIPTP